MTNGIKQEKSIKSSRNSIGPSVTNTPIGSLASRPCGPVTAVNSPTSAIPPAHCVRKAPKPLSVWGPCHPDLLTAAQRSPWTTRLSVRYADPNVISSSDTRCHISDLKRSVSDQVLDLSAKRQKVTPERHSSRPLKASKDVSECGALDLTVKSDQPLALVKVKSESIEKPSPSAKVWNLPSCEPQEEPINFSKMHSAATSSATTSNAFSVPPPLLHRGYDYSVVPGDVASMNTSYYGMLPNRMRSVPTLAENNLPDSVRVGPLSTQSMVLGGPKSIYAPHSGVAGSRAMTASYGGLPISMGSISAISPGMIPGSSRPIPAPVLGVDPVGIRSTARSAHNIAQDKIKTMTPPPYSVGPGGSAAVLSQSSPYPFYLGPQMSQAHGKLPAPSPSLAAPSAHYPMYKGVARPIPVSHKPSNSQRSVLGGYGLPPPSYTSPGASSVSTASYTDRSQVGDQRTSKAVSSKQAGGSSLHIDLTKDTESSNSSRPSSSNSTKHFSPRLLSPRQRQATSSMSPSIRHHAASSPRLHSPSHTATAGVKRQTMIQESTLPPPRYTDFHHHVQTPSHGADISAHGKYALGGSSKMGEPSHHQAPATTCAPARRASNSSHVPARYLYQVTTPRGSLLSTQLLYVAQN